MKIVKIGKTEYEQAENADDISIMRFVQLKEYLVYKETGINAPSLIDAIEGFIQGFDNNSKAQMLLTLQNYVTGLGKVNEGKDPDQLIYALITFEKDEDRKSYNEGIATEKLKRMADQGLTQGEVERTVENFMKASSSLYVQSFRRSLMRHQEEEQS